MHGVTRLEFEYTIPVTDASQTDARSAVERPLIEKTRYRRAFGGMTWEIDGFHGDNEGLVVARWKSPPIRTRRSTARGSGAKCRSDPRLPQFQPHQYPLQKCGVPTNLILPFSIERLHLVRV